MEELTILHKIDEIEAEQERSRTTINNLKDKSIGLDVMLYAAMLSNPAFELG